MDDNRQCSPCSEEQNQYENQIVSTLLKWLMTVTCIEWVRGYSDTQALDSVDVSSQYGTITINGITPSPHNTRVVGERTDNEACVVVHHSLDVDISLDVFNYQELCVNGGENKLVTSGDILLRVNDARQIERLGNYLLEKGLTITDAGSITNIYEIEGSVHLRRSTVNYKICVDRKTSYADDVIDGYCLSLECDKDCNKTVN